MQSEFTTPHERRLLARAMAIAIALHLIAFLLPLSLLAGKEKELTSRDISFLLEVLLAQEESSSAQAEAVEEPAQLLPEEEKPAIAELEPPAPEELPPELSEEQTPAEPVQEPAKEPGMELAAESSTGELPPSVQPEPVTPAGADEILRKLEDEKKEVMDLDRPPMSGPARSYLDRLRAKIAAAAFFPHEAQYENARGKVVVQVKILRNGTLDGVTLAKRSGFRCLDNAARVAVERAAPFEPLEDLVDMDYIRVNVLFRY